MADEFTHLNQLADAALGTCCSWLKADARGGIRLVDPVEGRPVPSHYGDTHLAAALIILGEIRGDEDLTALGIRLTETIVREWHDTARCIDFHNDFNNFALCLIAESLRKTSPCLSEEIQSLVLSTPDSSHDTINWLPMRAYVNRTRWAWKQDRKYEYASKKAIDLVSKAINDDGGIEDRLPRGRSYNLQYNVSSLAALQLFRSRWPSGGARLAGTLDFLLDHVLPDGDINYMGRGTNQIFAWGPWLYALASAGEQNALATALKFLDGQYSKAARNRNIFLSDEPGDEKLFWWDYHFCSVYHAHFLLWTVLALRDFCETGVGRLGSRDERSHTGLELKSGAAGGAAIFNGRSNYLAEAGPSVCAVWLHEKGVLFKGGLGPWQGSFGKRYSFADTIFQNHFGLISQGSASAFREGRLAKRLLSDIFRDAKAVLRPVFAPISVSQSESALTITWQTTGEAGYLNVPIPLERKDGIEVQFSVDERSLDCVIVGTFRNQYGWNSVMRCHPAQGRRWQVTIR